MIQLYKSTNTDYDMNGDYTLSPLSCKFECNLNDTWLLSIENPIDQSLDDFTIGAVISAPTPYGDKQLFRIYDVTKDDNGIIASAFPIFLDARNDCFLWDVRPSNVTGQTALNQMITNKKYSARSNITKTSTAYYVQKNLIEALNGDDDNAFLKRWGGEIAYNNYEIIVNDRIGSDNGLKVEFGFNLLGVEEQINNEDIVTRIIPKAYNGYILPNNETVDSPLINNYPIVYTRVIEYQDIKLIDDAQEDDTENGITVCNTLEELYTALRTRAQEEYENEIDLPQITYNVDMVDLSKTDLYKDYKDLLKVNLGDTVHVKHRKLGIETSARVIRLTYDCIAKKVESLVLGDYEANYFNDVSSITNSASQVINTSNNTLMADKIAGIINLLNTSLRAQKDIAQKQDVRAILFEDLDTDSPTFGALCIGTQGIQIAKERNETNTDWKWGTAIDFQSINADYIITGILTDKNGNFYLNMYTGELRMKDGTFIGNINGGTININNRFIVDKDGNVHIDGNGYFKGNIEGSNVSGGNISGASITGGSITSNTSINVTTDLKVGKNIYLDQNTPNTIKTIQFNGNNYIQNINLSGNNSYIKMQSNYRAALMANGGASVVVTGNAYGKVGVELTNPGDTIVFEQSPNSTYSAFFRPNSNGRVTLGGSAYRYYNIYLTHSPNVSSDRRTKKDFANFDERYIRLFEMIEPMIYQLKTASKNKSKLSGFIAQDIEEAMKECKIDKREFGIVKYDEESDSYALIYDMFIPLMFYYIQTEKKEFDQFKEDVEKRLSDLEVK